MRVKTDLKWDGDTIKLRGRKVVNKSVFETGLIVEGQAKVLAPKAEGRLAGSITTQSRTDGTFPSGKGSQAGDVISKPSVDGVVYVGTPVNYAPYMEFGTIHTPAQAFLRSALALAKGSQLTLVKAKIKNVSKYIFAEYIK